MGKSKIEWTDAVWNPVRGCSIVSAGCTNCYAMRYAHRFSSRGFPYEGLTKATHGGPVWTGEVRTVPGVLDVPIRWKRPRRIFVNSMSDLFHEGVADEFKDQVFAAMALAPQHVFQILTKRPERALAYLVGRSRSVKYWEAGARGLGYTFLYQDFSLVRFPLPNVWLGVSVEDQRSADERIPVLLDTPAAVRWISAEPLIGPVELRPQWFYADRLRVDSGLDWVVIGGESGPKARPFCPEWASAIIRQCKGAGVPVFVKQLGSRVWWEGAPVALKARKGGDPSEWPEDLRVREWPGRQSAEKTSDAETEVPAL